MLWLISQIWALLIAAFALGALTVWWLMRSAGRQSASAPAAASPEIYDASGLAEAPALHAAETDGPRDDLTQIIGVDADTQKALNALGVFYFSQIAAWSARNARWIDGQFDDPGRVGRERWTEQAAGLVGADD